MGGTRSQASTDAVLVALRRVLRERPEVRLAYLFGSRATGRARPGSDYDVAVLVDDEALVAPRHSFGTQAEIAGLLVDALRTDDVDVVLLNRAPPLLRHRVLRDGILLHARSEEERVRFARAALRDYLDAKYYLDRQIDWSIRRRRKASVRG